MWNYSLPRQDYNGDYTVTVTEAEGDVRASHVELGNAADLASAMAINRATAAKVVSAGIAGPIFNTGRGELVLRERIDALADLKQADPSPWDFLVLRVGPASPVDEEFDDPDDTAARPYTGWTCWADDEDENISGVDRWWRIPNAAERVGDPVVVTVGPVIVGIFQLEGYRASIEGLRWLKLDSAYEDVVDHFKDRRLDLPAGSPVVVLGGTSGKYPR